MDSNLPAPAPPPMQPNQPGQNPYAFITDDRKAGKKSLLPMPGGKKGRIVIVVGVLVGLAILASLVMAVFNGLDSAVKQDWLTLAQKQQELIRISDIGSTKAQNRDTKNLATTTKLSLEGSQSTINSLAKKNGAVINSKSLALGKSAETDAALKTAEQTNQFDATFQLVLKNELNEYQLLIKKLYDGTTSKSTKSGLQSAFLNAGILATEANR